MNILILTSRFSYPIHSGDTLRVHNIAMELSRSHNVTLVSIDGDGVELNGDDLPYECFSFNMAKTERLKGVASSIIRLQPIQYGYFDSLEFRNWYKLNKARFQGVVVHLSRLSNLVNPQDFSISVLEYTDCLAMMYSRAIKRLGFSIKQLLYRYESLVILKSDIKAFSSFNFGVFVSEADRSQFITSSSSIDPQKILAISNGVDLRDAPLNRKFPNGVLFIGNMRSLPNSSAVLFLLRKVYHEIISRNIDIEFHIVGWAPESLKREFSDLEGVFFHGICSEDELVSISENCFCGVAPIFAAAGIQNKLLDYISLCLPVISSSYAFEGLDYFDRKNFNLIEVESDFSTGICTIYREFPTWQEMASENLITLKKFYSWKAALHRYSMIFSSVDHES